MIAYFLAHKEGADPHKSAVMCLFHSFPEARIGDLHTVSQRYINKKAVVHKIMEDQFNKPPMVAISLLVVQNPSVLAEATFISSTTTQLPPATEKSQPSLAQKAPTKSVALTALMSLTAWELQILYEGWVVMTLFAAAKVLIFSVALAAMIF